MILADQDHVFFEYQPRHTSAAVCDMFRGICGYIQADAHSVYDAVFRGEARSSPGVNPPSEVACWSPARRKFWEAATVSKEPIAREALLRLRTIFDLERQWEKLPPPNRTYQRQKILKPIMTDLFRWIQACHAQVKDVRSLLSTATGDAIRHEAALLRFLENGRLKITNNHSERALWAPSPSGAKTGSSATRTITPRPRRTFLADRQLQPARGRSRDLPGRGHPRHAVLTARTPSRARAPLLGNDPSPRRPDRARSGDQQPERSG